MILAIDLDGTLTDCHDKPPWHAGIGPWQKDALPTLRSLLAAGHQVVIHTCRATFRPGGGTTAVVAFLEAGGFKPRMIVGEESSGMHSCNLVPQRGELGIWIGIGKPIADAYIDDRAIPHAGDWQSTTGLLQ